MSILLIEAKTRNQHPNLALLKLSTYYKQQGEEVVFHRGPLPRTFDRPLSKIFFSIIFSYYKKKNEAIFKSLVSKYSKDIIDIGGPYPSVCPEEIEKLFSIQPHIGKIGYVDEVPPDYSIVTDKKFQNRSFLITSRGCSNKCSFCIVSKIEPKREIISNWKDHIDPAHEFITIYDNNILAQNDRHIEDVFDHLAALKKKVIFDNGLDCRFFNDDYAKLLSSLNNEYIRFAFDSIKQMNSVEKTFDLLDKYKLPKSRVKFFALYNHTDTIDETITRCEYILSRGATPYLQAYRPLNMTSLKEPHIDEGWSLSIIRKLRYFYSIPTFYRYMKFREWEQKGCPTLPKSKVNFNC